ncbi:MAG TPA: hypothetical protein VJG32_17995 [Anaerolineae bacterium]|nr:hypothetical protein [Anaerolineae bacterium]
MTEPLIVLMHDYLIDTLAGDPLMADVKLFVRGQLPPAVQVPDDFYPLIEVYILEEELDDELTGGYRQPTYNGVISITARDKQARDTWRTPVSKRLTMTSYNTVIRLLANARRILEREEHKALGGLRAMDDDSEEEEIVTQFLLDSPIEHGAGENERDLSYENVGVIPFSVQAERAPANPSP